MAPGVVSVQGLARRAGAVERPAVAHVRIEDGDGAALAKALHLLRVGRCRVVHQLVRGLAREVTPRQHSPVPAASLIRLQLKLFLSSSCLMKIRGT